MIDIFESRYPEWKRGIIRKVRQEQRKQLPALIGVIVLGCAFAVGVAAMARSLGA